MEIIHTSLHGQKWVWIGQLKEIQCTADCKAQFLEILIATYNKWSILTIDKRAEVARRYGKVILLHDNAIAHKAKPV